jgi:hypothetical protein
VAVTIVVEVREHVAPVRPLLADAVGPPPPQVVVGVRPGVEGRWSGPCSRTSTNGAGAWSTHGRPAPLMMQ